jgi:O-antigen/teichoic acid export membrane protein
MVSGLRLDRLFDRLRGNETLRHMSMLASGVLLAQVITLASSPVLTRLYGPEGFAGLALFMAFVDSLSPGICGRYEIAQAVVKSRRERDLLFALSIWIAGVAGLLLLLVMAVFFDPLLRYFNAEGIGRTVLFFPLGLVLFGVVLALRYYANSEKRYDSIGRMSVAQALGITLGTVALAGLTGSDSGLILGTVLGYLLAMVYMAKQMQGSLSRVRLLPGRLHLRIADKYRRFPLYVAPSSILNGVTLSMPVFFLARDYPEAVVGYYALLVRVAAAPVGFISTAMAQVHLRRVAEMVHRAEPAFGYLLRATAVLGGVMLVPAVLFFAAAPPIFAGVFGEEWHEAGVLLQILMPALALKFIVSPLSSVFSSTGNDKLGAIWRIGAFAVTLGVFYLYSGSLDVRSIFVLMAVNDLVLYAIHYGLIVYSVRNPGQIS